MAGEIVLGKLVLDTSDLQSSMAQSKKAIIDLENEQKKLKKETDNLSGANEQQLQSFVDNEAQLKKMKSEYAANQKSVLDLAKAQTGLDSALAQNVKTQNEAIANTKALTEARKQIDTTTVDGAKAIADINAKIDQNNKLVNENSSALEKQKNNVGNYPEILSAVNDGLDKMVPGFTQARTVVAGFSSIVGESADKVTGYANSAIQSTRATLGFQTASQLATASTIEQTVATEAQAAAQTEVTVATSATTGAMNLLKLAIIATGIGALVILLVSVATALSQNEQASNKFSKALAGFKGVLNAVFAVLRPLGEFLIDNIVAAFELAGEAAEKALDLIAKGLAAVGFDKAAASVTGFTKSVKESVIATRQLDEAEKSLQASQRLSQKIQLDYQKTAEKLRQARDDDSKSINDRIKANEQLGEVLVKQSAEETKIAQQAVANANLRIKLTGKSRENLEALAEAQTEVSDIQERIAGQESEQLANLNSLRKEAADKAKETRDKTLAAEIKSSQNKIDILKAEAEQSNLTTAQKIANAEKVYELQNELAKKTLEGSDQTKQLIANRQELSSAILALIDEQISKEIEAQKKASESKKALTELELLNAKDDAEFLAQAQIALLNKRLLTEKAYADEVAKINLAKNESIAAANLVFAETEKARLETEALNVKALDEIAFQTRLVDIEAQNATEAEIKEALLAENYAREKELLEQSLKDKTISNDVYLAKLGLANKKYNAETAKNDKILAKQKEAQAVGMLNTGLDALGQLFEGSKAIAVAQALVNTYQGISAGVALGYPMAIPAVAFAALSGFAAVKNILKTTKTSTSADTEGSKPAVTSGAGAFVNTAQTETIARATERPTDTQPIAPPPVLILESLHEAQNNLAIKIQS